MAGYSGTPLPQKLGLKPGARFGLVKPPVDFARTLGKLPDGVAARELAAGKSQFDVIVCFAPTMAEVARRIPALKTRLDPAGGLWMAWPKKTRKPTRKPAPGPATDVTENDVRAVGLAAGLVDNKVCAIDDVWSGLRFVFRLVDRPKGTKR
jgi:hypothetical protein